MRNIKYKKIIESKKFARWGWLTAGSRKQTASSGFTIVETMIALTIFSIAITGVITVANKGSLNINTAKNRLIATYLADEGIELMRAMRDTTALSFGGPTTLTGGWNSFITTSVAECGGTSPVCDIDAPNYALTPPPYPQFGNFTVSCPTTTIPGITGNYCPLFYDPATGFYNNRGGPGNVRTPFSRALKVLPIGLPNEVQVTSTVVWQEGSVGKTLTQTENLFDWYPI